MVSTLLKVCFFGAVVCLVSTTDRPIIGVVLHEITYDRTRELAPNSTAYLAASYVQAVQAAGARVAVIKLNQQESYYVDILNQVNGILLPGGDAEFDKPHGYAAAIDILYKQAVKLNEAKDHMPILGICLGLEVLMHISNKGKELRTDCSSNNVALPLQFKPDFQDSKLFRDADPYILQILSTQPVTANHHSYCVTEKNFTKFGLDKEWKVLSTNEDEFGLEFISTVESKRHPFVGVQFHPEKNAFEWKRSQNNPHSADAVYSARHFFDWLVKESKKSNHSFVSNDAEYDALIENYSPRFTGRLNMTFEQIYVF